MTPDQLIPLLVVLPLAGFLVTALIGRRLGKQAHWIPVLVVLGAWVIAMGLAYNVLTGAAPLVAGSEDTHAYVVGWFTWIPADRFVVEVGFYVDALTACLLIVVTTIGLLVHVYSIGYMSHDPGYWRFFAYLNLFMFSMLLLVLAASWLVVFVAWELVGLSSYLLIGFWYRKRSAALAAKKAFIVNRVGDVGFALGIMAIFVNTGTLDIRQSIEVLTSPTFAAFPIAVPVVALLVFAGAMGKSAQFPLHVWLPDAMEGPTPVSALIHAATMVNAGVYLVARANPLFAASPDAMVVVAGIGIFTAILAASIAMTQTDIKRVLAYSTLSQLGYMFAALGVGAFTAAIFHLMTHGFFKGLLFLGSGSVIHAVHEEQDMRRMGGLSKKIPITYVTMLIGSLAIAGIPPLAGFFSKDEILGESFKLGFMWVWLVGFVVAGLTAFYMFRLMGLTFWGTFRGPKAIWDKIHESSPVMTIPLILLAIPSALLGLALGLPFGSGPIKGWLEPVFHDSAGGARPRVGELRAVRDRWRPDPRERHRGGRGDRHRLATVRRRAAGPAPGQPTGAGPRDLGEGAVPLPGVAQQVVVRRPEPPAVHRHRRPDRERHVVVRPRGGRRDRQRHRPRHGGLGARAPPRPDRARPELRAGHRHRPDRDGGLVPRAGGALSMDLASLPILTIVTFLPLVGAVAVAVLPASAARPVALGFALATWVVSLVLLVAYLPQDAGFQYTETADWIPFFGIQYKVGADGLSVALVVLTTTLSWISILASFTPIQTRIKEYMVSFLVLEVGMIGVFLALDLFLFYIFWEIVLVPMYLIIGIWGGANRIYATIKFVLYTLVGSLLMLVAILATAYAYQATTGSWVGAFDFETLRTFATTPGSGFADALQIGAFIAFFLAFAIKVPMFPFHTWLPDAHTEAPTAGSVILAAIMLKLGAYGFIRFAVPLFPDAAQTFAPVIIVLSLIAIIYGAIVALVQPDLKRLVAYSSVSHMGFVTLGLFVFTQQGIQGAILQMINHGLITGALFLLVGVIYERTHDRTIAKMGGLAAKMPVYVAVFGFFVFASGGLPGLSGLRRGVPRARRDLRGEPVGGGHRRVRHDPGRRLPALHVPTDRLR